MTSRFWVILLARLQRLRRLYVARGQSLPGGPGRAKGGVLYSARPLGVVLVEVDPQALPINGSAGVGDPPCHKLLVA
eukprot:460249-Pyramimonas_sp.AAC.1